MRFKSPQGNNDQGPFKSQSASLLSAGLARVAVYLPYPTVLRANTVHSYQLFGQRLVVPLIHSASVEFRETTEICNSESIPFWSVFVFLYQENFKQWGVFLTLSPHEDSNLHKNNEIANFSEGEQKNSTLTRVKQIYIV